MPDLRKESLEKIVGCVGMTGPAAENLVEGMTAIPPQGLGYPSDTAVSSYYLGDHITRTEIKEIQLAMQEKGYESENTRVRKTTEHGSAVYEVLQASYDLGSHNLTAVERLGGSEVTLMKGDHRNQVSNIGS